MKKALFLAAKLALSVALVWYAFSKIDTGSALSELASLPAVTIAIALALIVLQYMFTAWRLNLLLREIGARLSIEACLDAVFIGAFFSQTLISFVGGDAMRVWRLAKQRVPVGEATRSVLLDRLFGFIGLILLIIAALPVLFGIIHDSRVHGAILLLVAAAVMGCTFLLLASRLPYWLRRRRLLGFVAELSIMTRAIIASHRVFLKLICISVAVQAVNVLVIWTTARGLSVNLSMTHCLVLVPPVLFLSMMPISFAGWGVRESAMVAALGAVGVPPSQSLALSLSYGIALVLVSLPGGALWFYNRARVEDAMPPDSSGT